MEINNFEIVKNILKFTSDGDTFYFLQIMQRKKDGEDIKKNNRIITNYYITSLDYFNDREQEIIDLCKKFHARAYLNLNPCSFKKCCMYAIKELADINISGNYRGILNLMPTLAGKHTIGGDTKTWLIDYDSKDDSGLNTIRNFIKDMDGKEGKGVDKVKAIIPTKNGFHIICTPFDPRQFSTFCKDNLPFCELHTNNPTLLYFNYGENN